MSKLLGPMTLRPLGEEWCALNKREKGFASFGYSFDFLGDALDEFNARVTGWGYDKHGLYLTAESKGDAS